MQTATKSNSSRQVLLKLEKSEDGPYESICMYVQTGSGNDEYTVVAHSYIPNIESKFDVVLYRGFSKESATASFYEMVLREPKNNSNNIDDQL
tara:strand:- start:1489 stop:1767 length:279 start_codon:yes stop_codon:yes gene_type:complete